MTRADLVPPFGEPVNTVPPVDDRWRAHYQQVEAVLARFSYTPDLSKRGRHVAKRGQR